MMTLRNSAVKRTQIISYKRLTVVSKNWMSPKCFVRIICQSLHDKNSAWLIRMSSYKKVCHSCSDSPKCGCSDEQPTSTSDEQLSDCCSYSGDVITDTDILDYILWKYRLDKNKIICMMMKTKENELKRAAFQRFYQEYPCVINKEVCEQYKIFKKWYYENHDLYLKFTDDEFEVFYEKYICSQRVR